MSQRIDTAMKESIGAKSLLYPHPVLLVGTYDAEAKPDAMVVAWGGICSSNPPSVAISVQKSRKTYENLILKKEFTISIPTTDLAAEADYCGIDSGKTVDKFTATGLTPVKSSMVDAPYIDECPVVLECRVTDILEIGIHTQFVAEILDIKVDEAVLYDDGKPDIRKIRPILYDSIGREYLGVGEPVAKAFSSGLTFRK